MGECFDLTFFMDNTKINENQSEEHFLRVLNINCGKNQLNDHIFPLFTGKEVHFEIYSESDFTGYWVAIAELVFTKKNFDDKLNQMLEVVTACFDSMPQILFATGIYQMTDYYIQGIRRITDFTQTVFSNFPFLFFRRGKEFGFVPTQRYGSVSCVVQLGANIQDVFASPIGELMEDEGLSFEEAQTRLARDRLWE